MRLRVRWWARLADWTEQRCRRAYNQLVDREST